MIRINVLSSRIVSREVSTLNKLVTAQAAMRDRQETAATLPRGDKINVLRVGTPPGEDVNVYGLFAEGDSENVVYVGSTRNVLRRYRAHQRLEPPVSSLFQIWKGAMRDSGREVRLKILETCSRQNALACENKWIASCREQNPNLFNRNMAIEKTALNDYSETQIYIAPNQFERLKTWQEQSGTDINELIHNAFEIMLNAHEVRSVRQKRIQRGYVYEASGSFFVRYYVRVIIDGLEKRVQRSSRLCAKDAAHETKTSESVVRLCDTFMQLVMCGEI